MNNETYFVISIQHIQKTGAQKSTYDSIISCLRTHGFDVRSSLTKIVPPLFYKLRKRLSLPVKYKEDVSICAIVAESDTVNDSYVLKVCNDIFSIVGENKHTHILLGVKYHGKQTI